MAWSRYKFLFFKGFLRTSYKRRGAYQFRGSLLCLKTNNFKQLNDK